MGYNFGTDAILVQLGFNARRTCVSPRSLNTYPLRNTLLISSLSIWAYSIEKIFLVVAGVAGSVVMTNDILQALEITAGMTMIRSLMMIGSDCHFSFLQRLEFFTFANPIFNR